MIRYLRPLIFIYIGSVNSKAHQVITNYNYTKNPSNEEHRSKGRSLARARVLAFNPPGPIKMKDVKVGKL